MGQLLNISEIKNLYPDEWVLLGNPIMDDIQLFELHFQTSAKLSAKLFPDFRPALSKRSDRPICTSPQTRFSAVCKKHPERSLII